MIFFLITFGILAMIYGYIGWRMIIPAGLPALFSAILWAVLIFFLFIPHISISMRIYGYRNLWTDLLTWIAYLSLGFFTLVFPLLIVRDVTSLVAVGVKKSFALVQNAVSKEIKSADPADPERRRILLHTLNMGILGVSGILCGYGLYEARRSPRIVNVMVPIHNLPEDLENLRIVQITDIHVSPTIKRKYVQTIVDEVNRLEPDIIVFTGDLADGSVSDFRNDVAPLTELSATYGSYFVTGNHEYYSGVEAWLEEINKLGFDVLLNEHRIIQHGAGKILLAGVPDYNAGQFISSHASSPKASLEGAPLSDVKLLLAHQPRSVSAAAREGFDILISGHTHGGQYFPWNFLVGLQQPYTSGLHRHEETWIYVSCGTGYWGPPYRIGMPSEITVFTLIGTNSA